MADNKVPVNVEITEEQNLQLIELQEQGIIGSKAHALKRGLILFLETFKQKKSDKHGSNENKQ